MGFLCVFGCAHKPRKIVAVNRKTMLDFRRADPKFVNFVPQTCVEAIDLFVRHRKLGLQAKLYPECFVHCARQLPGPELDKFHRWIVCPNGDIAKGGEKPTEIDRQLEVERLAILAENELRDMERLTIAEESEEKMEVVNDQEEEKMSIDETYIKIVQG